MSMFTRKFLSLTEGFGEGQRWSGRTQSAVSRSPQQREYERRYERQATGGLAA
jgi:hypothetical protein